MASMHTAVPTHIEAVDDGMPFLEMPSHSCSLWPVLFPAGHAGNRRHMGKGEVVPLKWPLHGTDGSDRPGAGGLVIPPDDREGVEGLLPDPNYDELA